MNTNRGATVAQKRGHYTLERNRGQVKLATLIARPASRRPWLIFRQQGAVKRLITGLHHKREAYQFLDGTD